MKTLFKAFIFLSATIFYAQNAKIEVINTSINSVYAEMGITYLNDKTVVFASSKKVETDKNFSKSRRKTNAQLFLELYIGSITETGDIIQTGKLSKKKNTVFFESDISFTPDRKTIYFTWNNFSNTQTRKDSAKWKTLQLMKATINQNFEISNIKSLPFNSPKYSVRNPAISKNGKQLFFISDMPGSFGGTDIYVVDILEDGTYSEPKNLGENINTKKSELFPFVDQNNVLYFSSYGHKGLGSLDIYKSEFVNNSYGKSENLQAPINSKYDDFAYVINSKDSTGYFTSNRKGSVGDVDIYAFKPIKKKCKPTLLLSFINEKTNVKEADISFEISENNQLLTSQLFQEKSKSEFQLKCHKIYKITASKDGFYPIEIEFKTGAKNETFSKEIYLKPIECKQLISGFVFNNNDQSTLNGVSVKLFENDKILKSQLTQAEKAFNFEVKCDKSYTIIAEKEGFISSKQEINTSAIQEKNWDLTFNLKPIECNSLISGTILDSETKKPLQNAIVKVFKQDVFVKNLQLNLAATFNFKAECNSKYKVVASLKNYTLNSFIFNTSNKNNEHLSQNISLDFIVETTPIVVEKNSIKTIQTNTIYFDLDSDEIRPDAAIEINKVVAILRKYPTIKIEVKSHTDSRAPDDYNLSLSNRRAISTVNYIISQGIDSSRLTGKGLGETQLINKCANGVKCTNAEHELNRRTEFIIIED